MAAFLPAFLRFQTEKEVRTKEDCSGKEAERVLGEDEEPEEETKSPQKEVNFKLYDDQEPNVIKSRPIVSGLSASSSAINAGLGSSSSLDTQNQIPKSDQNRDLVLSNRCDSRTSQVMMTPVVNVGLGGGSSSSSLGTQTQILRIAQPKNSDTIFANIDINVAPWRPPNQAITRPNNSATRTSASADLTIAPRRPPNQTNTGGANRNHVPPRPPFGPYPQHSMPNQNVFPRPPFFVDQNYFNQPFGMWSGQASIWLNQQQGQMVLNLVPGQVPMWPMMYNQQQDQMVPNIFPVQSSMWPMMYNQPQVQMVPNILPVQAPMWPMVPSTTLVPDQAQMWMYNQMFPNLLPGQDPTWPMTYNQQQVLNAVVQDQAPLRPMMHNQQQDQIVPSVGIGQAPMMQNQQQDQMVPSIVRGEAPMMQNQQQDQMVPSIVRGQAPMMQNQQQDQMVPSIVRGQAPMMQNQQQDQMVPRIVRGQAPMSSLINNTQVQEVQIVIPNETAAPWPELDQEKVSEGLILDQLLTEVKSSKASEYIQPTMQPTPLSQRSNHRCGGTGFLGRGRELPQPR